MRTGSNIRQRTDGRYEARYIKSRDENGRIVYGYCYGSSYEEAEEKRDMIMHANSNPRQMNLLVLGAGVCGQEVKELAEQLRVFNRIDFLEDFGNCKEAIGKCEDAAGFLAEYPMAIPAVGDNDLRKRWFKMLVKAGFIIPTLIHPSANISHNSEFGSGSIICAGATISQNVKMGYGCLISSGATVNRNITLQDWSYADCGEIIKE